MQRLQRRSKSLIAVCAIPFAGALVFGIGAMRAPAAAGGGLTLEASLSERTISVMQGGETIKSYAVAIGAPSHPTPTGTFDVRKLVWNPRWVPPDEKWARGKSPKPPGHPANPMKTVKIFFRQPDYYIHGTGNVESLGTAASHGCLRMDPDEAAELGLMLMENAGVARDWDWVKSILNLGDQKVVGLQLGAPLTVVR